MAKQTTRRARPANGKQWETVAPGTDRLEVPGGWVYRTVKRGAGVATCFVPREPALDAQKLTTLQRTARELKQKLEQLRALLQQLAAARRLRNAPVRGLKVH